MEDAKEGDLNRAGLVVEDAKQGDLNRAGFVVEDAKQGDLNRAGLVVEAHGPCNFDTRGASPIVPDRTYTKKTVAHADQRLLRGKCLFGGDINQSRGSCARKYRFGAPPSDPTRWRKNLNHRQKKSKITRFGGENAWCARARVTKNETPRDPPRFSLCPRHFFRSQTSDPAGLLLWRPPKIRGDG